MPSEIPADRPITIGNGAGELGIGAATAPEADLATLAPGAACAEQAKALRSRAPLRSRAQRLLGQSTAEAWLRTTAGGERKVAAVLARLGPSWRVLHSVPVGGDRPAVSHLVIGPRGVFTLTTRTFRRGGARALTDPVEAQVLGDEIRIEGETMPYMPQARAQAWRSAQALSRAAGEPVYVRPAVVILGVDDVRWYTEPSRVEVLPRRHLLRWLNGFPEQLSDADVARVYAVARRGETWIERGSGK